MNNTELQKLIQAGTRAKDLSEFLTQFVRAEKERAINELLNTSRDANLIRADLKADMRIVGHITSIINKGKIAEVYKRRNIDGN